MLYIICIYYSFSFLNNYKNLFCTNTDVRGSLPQTFSTIPRKNFTDRPYNKPGQVGYFKVVPRGYKCENM